jgi:hypothetical protein
MFSALTQLWQRATSGARRPRPRRTTRRAFRPCLRVLEDRCVPSTTAVMASPNTLRINADQALNITGGAAAYQVKASDLVNGKGRPVSSLSFTGVQDIQVYYTGTNPANHINLSGGAGSAPLAGSVNVVASAAVTVIDSGLSATGGLQVVGGAGAITNVTVNAGTSLGNLLVDAGGGVTRVTLTGAKLTTGQGTLSVFNASTATLTIQQTQLAHWVNVSGTNLKATISGSTLGSGGNNNSSVQFTAYGGDDNITVNGNTTVNGNFTVLSTGKGSNDVTLDYTKVNGTATATGGGDGSFLSTFSVFNGGLDVNFGSATLPSSIMVYSDQLNGELWIQTGSGDDQITLIGFQVGPKDQAHFGTTSTITTGTGSDTVTLDGGLAGPTVFYPGAPQFFCHGTATLKLLDETLQTAFPNTTPKGHPMLSPGWTIA